MLSSSLQVRRYATLAVVLLVAVGTVGVIAIGSRERIAANERAWFVAKLDALLPQSLHDNDLFADSRLLDAPELSNLPTTVYRARRDGQPSGVIFTATATDGYGGPIDMLVALNYQGAVLGVDILRHHETQGIGDGFLPERSDWVQRLVGRSLDNTPPARWSIRKDGGDFDQFTSASVTPRAILKSVRRILEYYAQNREQIYR